MSTLKIYGTDTHISTMPLGLLGFDQNTIIKAIRDFATTYLKLQQISDPLQGALDEANQTGILTTSQDSPFNRLFLYFRLPNADLHQKFLDTELAPVFDPNSPCGFPKKPLINSLEKAVSVVQVQMQEWDIEGLIPSLPNKGHLFETPEAQAQYFINDKHQRMEAIQQILDIHRQYTGEAGWQTFKKQWGQHFYAENGTLLTPSSEMLGTLLKRQNHYDYDLLFPEKAVNTSVFSNIPYQVKYAGLVAQECAQNSNTENLSRGAFEQVETEGLGALLSFKQGVDFSKTKWILTHEIAHMYGDHIHELENTDGKSLLRNINPDLMALLCGPRRANPDGAPGAASIYPSYCANNGYQIERGNSTALAFPGLPERDSFKIGYMELMHAKILLAPDAEKPKALEYGVNKIAHEVKTMHAQECMAQFGSAFTRTFMSTLFKGWVARAIQNPQQQRVAFAAAHLLATTLAAMLLSANGHHAACMVAAGAAGFISPSLGALADLCGSAQTMNMIVELYLEHSWARALLAYQIVGQVLARLLGELCLSAMYRGVARPQAYLEAQGIEYNNKPSNISVLAIYISAQLPSVPNSLRQSKVAGLLCSLGTRLQTTLQKAHTIDTQIANTIKSWCSCAKFFREILVPANPLQTETGAGANAV